MSIYIRMPTINFSVTQSIETLAVNLSASEALVMNINNPLIGASYFGLETIPDNNGVYTSTAPKNTSGSFTLGTGVLGVVRDDYKMSAVVSPGNNVLTFSPAVAVTGSTLWTRGINSSMRYDSDVQAFFDRVATAGGTLTTTEKDATNQLVLDMKSAGIWSSMVAIYPMVGASAAACAQNLKSSSFTGTFSSGWTFASTGVKGNGNSAYMNTGLLSNDFTDNKGGYTCYTRDNNSPTGTKVQYGSFDTNWVISWMNIKAYALNVNSNYVSFSSIPDNYKGSVINQRVDNSNVKINFSGGNQTVSSTIPTPLGNTTTIYLGAWGNGGSGAYHTDNEIAFFAKHDFIDETKSVNFINLVQAFQTTLGRQV